MKKKYIEKMINKTFNYDNDWYNKSHSIETINNKKYVFVKMYYFDNITITNFNSKKQLKKQLKKTRCSFLDNFTINCGVYGTDTATYNNDN